MDLEAIRRDFDRIAVLTARRPEQGEIYDRFLIARVRQGCGNLLEIGCGSGRMARLLAGRARRVVGIDVSPRIIELAAARSQSSASPQFVCDDFMMHSFAGQRFDCIFTVTTLHHMPYAPALARMKALLAPEGTLIIHDVRAASGVRDWLSSGIRATARGEIVHWLSRRLSTRGELAQAWRDHGATDRYLDMKGVRALAAAHLPGATVYDHPLWRYSIVWRKELQHNS